MSKLSELRDAQKAAPKKRTKSFLEDIRDGLGGYWTRQGKMAQGGLDWANKGFEKVRGGDPLGLLDEAGGALSYLASPVTALVPTRDEIAASQTPEWAKPIMSGAAQSALFALPGPDLGPAASTAGGTLRGVRDQAQMYMDDFAQKFGADIPAGAEVYGSGPVIRKPLGSNLGDLMAGGTEAERAALKARLDAEAAQTLPPFTAYHGSPVEGLTVLKPGERGPFGPANYLSPVEGVARRYGGNLYQTSVNPNEIFNGLGSRYFDGDVNGYELWRNQVARVAKASGAKADEVAAALGKLDPQDGYRAYHDLRRIMGSDAEAQAVLQRAGFKGVSGHVDGPEVAMFGDVDLGAAPATRDQALRNLTEAPTDPWLKPTPMDNYREAASLRMKIEPLETQLKAALQSKNATKAATLREKLKVIRDRVAQLSPDGPLLSADRVDEILRAHPNADLSAEDIAKMFPEGQ